MAAHVVVYTRPLCLFCQQVLDLLQKARVVYQQIEVPVREDQDRLVQCYDARSFPIVLADGKYLGGYAHLLQLFSEGRLQKLGQASEAASAATTALPPSARSNPQGMPASRVPRSLVGDMSLLFKALKDEPKKK